MKSPKKKRTTGESDIASDPLGTEPSIRSLLSSASVELTPSVTSTSPTPTAPRGPTIEKYRKSRNIKYDSEESVRSALRDFLVYLIFLAVTIIVACASHTPYMYFFNKTVKDLFLSRTNKNSAHEPEVRFTELVTTADFWSFLELKFLDDLHGAMVKPPTESVSQGARRGREATAAPSADSKGSLLFLDENVVLGPPRLRQIRVKKDSCHVHSIFDKYFKECYAEYSSSVQDTKGSHQGTSYSTSEEIYSHRVWGKIASYGGGGYVKDLTYDIAQNRAIIKELKSEKWIDRATRLVLVEFTLYNANMDLFNSIKFIGELPPTGGVITSASMQTVKLTSIFLDGNFFYLIAAVVFYAMVLFYTLQELAEMHQIGLSNYVCLLWNFVDLTILILAYVSLAYNIWHPFYAKRLIERLNDSPEKHLSLDSLCFWNEIYQDVIAMGAFLVCIKIFKYISFNKSMLQFSTTLRRCSNDLLGFSVMFFIVFLAYAQLGLLLFGTVHKDFRNFKESVLTMIRMVLGDFEYAEIERANRMLGPIYFLTYILLVFFILLNMFLAIIIDTYSEVKSEVAGGHNYLQEYVVRILGRMCGRRMPPTERRRESPAKPAPAAAAEAGAGDELHMGAGDELHMGSSDILKEYFEEMPQGRDTAHIIRLTARVAALEDVLQQLVSDMDTLLRRVAPKRRI